MIDLSRMDSVVTFECSRCGEPYQPSESEAFDPFRFCTPECEGDAYEEEEAAREGHL